MPVRIHNHQRQYLYFVYLISLLNSMLLSLCICHRFVDGQLDMHSFQSAMQFAIQVYFCH
jgi:hypothetical protein